MPSVVMFAARIAIAIVVVMFAALIATAIVVVVVACRRRPVHMHRRAVNAHATPIGRGAAR
jgi:hypothetical protein